jgi:Tol biopolymer transport system component
MALQSGDQLGPYEVLSAIGAGGMGEVYKARDTRLDRIVAIKVLPSHLAGRAELRERFDREARAIANLQHPNICVLYDIGEQDGTAYLVMEYLEGETLEERLRKGPQPLDQVLQYAIEISDALDKAHRQGFTHRDIKPANIMLTKAGSKILDFGLAKLKQQAARPVALASDAPTLSAPRAPESPTLEGTILGTVQYMAPEQVEGKIDEIDGRSDIFAFGAVVYEMLTGKKAFEGKTAASVMAKILEVDPPPMSSLQPMTPPILDRVVQTCLAKAPDDRWQTARDLWRELKWIKEGGSEVGAASTARLTPTLLQRWALQLGAGVLALGILVGGLAVWNLKPTTVSPPAARFTVALPPGERLAGLDLAAIAFSPDATQLAYVAERDGIQWLFLRALSSSDARRIPGTEGAGSPFFSPDGQWLGFFSEGKLRKISVTGGAPTVLASTSVGRGGSWGNDGQIIFAPDTTTGLWRVPVSGGAPESLTTLDGSKSEGSHRFPHHLPGGSAILFTVGTGGSWDDARIEMLRLDTRERKILIEGGSDGRYVPTGHIVYVRAGALMAVPFDLDRLEVTGPPFAVVEGVMQSADNAGAAHISFSDRGWLVYIPGGAPFRERSLAWVDRQGAEQPLQVPPRPYRTPRISADGQRLALDIDEGNRSDVWVYDIPRGTLTRLTFEASSEFPLWTADGNRLTFTSTRAGSGNLFWKAADGSGVEERLTTSEQTQLAGSWSPDGQVLAFTEGRPSTGTDIWMLSLKEDFSGPATPGPGQTGQDRKAQPFLQTPFNEVQPAFSADGRWLAYASNESGRYEVYVQPFPGGGGKVQISTEGGAAPLWERSGRELFYRNGDKMMKVDVTTQPAFRAARPQMLFAGHYWSVGSTSVHHDVSPDGQRFLMIKPGEQEASATQINVVLNWFEELKQRVPVK